jgi:hypothetical protein
VNKKVAPNVNDPVINRAFNEIYDTLNDLLSSSNFNKDGSLSTTSGKIGDFKVIKDFQTKRYKLAGKGIDGWVVSPGYLHTGTGGILLNQAEFTLTKYDDINYKNTTFSILNENANESTSLKLGSLASYLLLDTSKIGVTTLSTTGPGTRDSDLLIDVDGAIELEAADNEAVTIDANCIAANSTTNTGLLIDYDHTIAAALGQTITNEAVDVNLNSNSPTHIGIIINKAYSATVTGGTSGAQTGYAFYGHVDGHDTNNGIYLNVKDGGEDIKLVSSADVQDYFTIATTTNGATTIATVDGGATAANLTLDADGTINLDSASGITNFYLAGDTDDACRLTVQANGATTLTTADSDGAAGHLTFDIDGDIILDSHTGNFVAKKAGTEFSVANSAYAGMILGYRMIGEDATHTSYTMTTSFAVPNSDMTVRFVAPPSGCVEVMVQIYANASTSNRLLYFGLSDNATYNSLGATYEQLHRMPDETDDSLVQHYWTITGLTAGTTYNYWFGAKISGVTAWLNWGGTGSGRYGDFIMKVTALPAATSDFAEYD